jgi:hypothetical protein
MPTLYPDDCTNPEVLAEARRQLREEFPTLTEQDIENLCGQRAVSILAAQRGTPPMTSENYTG